MEFFIFKPNVELVECTLKTPVKPSFKIKDYLKYECSWFKSTIHVNDNKNRKKKKKCTLYMVTYGKPI